MSHLDWKLKNLTMKMMEDSRVLLARIFPTVVLTERIEDACDERKKISDLTYLKLFRKRSYL
jgi:hypothetical protein